MKRLSLPVMGLLVLLASGCAMSGTMEMGEDKMMHEEKMEMKEDKMMQEEKMGTEGDKMMHEEKMDGM